jgi:hypothetical protein
VKNHVISRALCVFGASAALTSFAHAGITGIYKTNYTGTSATQLTLYTSLANVASNTGGVNSNLTTSMSDARYMYVFGDFTQAQNTQGYMYKTLYNGSGRVSQIVRYVANSLNPIENLRTDTGGQVFNLTGFGGSGGWDREDDFFHDGSAFYRNRTVSGGSNGVTKYATFSDLVSNTNGTTYNYGITYGYNDRFFGFEGKIYRTNTGGPGGSVNGIAVYNSFNDLLNRNVAQTINSSNWSAGDMFIAVPTPGAMALVGLAGLVSRRRKD